MKHPFVHQQAATCAQQLVNARKNELSFHPMLTELFLRLFSRRPTDKERDEYTHFFKKLAANREITNWNVAVESAVVWKDLIHTLYNLKEFTYVL